jgi:hypothetical protein
VVPTSGAHYSQNDRTRPGTDIVWCHCSPTSSSSSTSSSPPSSPSTAGPTAIGTGPLRRRTAHRDPYKLGLLNEVTPHGVARSGVKTVPYNDQPERPFPNLPSSTSSSLPSSPSTAGPTAIGTGPLRRRTAHRDPYKLGLLNEVTPHGVARFGVKTVPYNDQLERSFPIFLPHPSLVEERSLRVRARRPDVSNVPIPLGSSTGDS